MSRWCCLRQLAFNAAMMMMATCLEAPPILGHLQATAALAAVGPLSRSRDAAAEPGEWSGGRLFIRFSPYPAWPSSKEVQLSLTGIWRSQPSTQQLAGSAHIPPRGGPSPVRRGRAFHARTAPAVAQGRPEEPAVQERRPYLAALPRLATAATLLRDRIQWTHLHPTRGHRQPPCS